MRSALTVPLLALFVVIGCAPAPKGPPVDVNDLPRHPDRDPPPVDRAEAAWRAAEGLLLFFPTAHPDGNWQPAGLTFEEAWFNAADGTRLHGWYCPCDRPRAVLLFAHGNAGNLSHRADRLKYLQHQLRVTTLIFDYRGYGRSEGVPTVEGVIQDGQAARSFLARRAGVKEADVVLLGRSLGGAVAAHLAGESPARGLILEATFSSLREAAAHLYPQFAHIVPADKLHSAERLARYEGPLLQSHGDADQAIPYALGEKLFQSARGPKRWVRLRGAGHNDPPTADYFRELDRFIADLPAVK